MSTYYIIRTGAEIIPLHDAYMAALHQMDEAGYQYNKNTVELHKEYSLIREILEMAKATSSIIEGTHPSGLSLKDDLPPFLDNLKINSKNNVFSNSRAVTVRA